ncbi:MAG: thioredoxin [Bacilli bacterium]|nr:thioredoxin [Bacilli bacterium]MDD4718596.1 thioredoxin [Bacilli bacterium]
MMLINGNENNFNELVAKDLVLVDFFAEWCGPCRMLGPVLDEIAEDRSDFDIVKINIDENQSLAQKFGVMSVPTLMIFKQGEPVAVKSGFMPKELLVNWVNDNK